MKQREGVRNKYIYINSLLFSDIALGVRVPFRLHA